MTMFRRSLGVLGIIACSFANAQGAETDVKRSWEKAVVYLPNSSRSTGVGDVRLDKPCPVAIYMHGCAGIESSSDNRDWARLIAKQGVLVVMPDSLARTDRKPSCDPKTKRGGLFPPVHDMRLEEIRFAADEIKKQLWFDGKNLFLMGFSEGAIAAVRTPLPGFRGVIATGWLCSHSKAPAFDGIFLPPDTPLLTINHSEDSWLTAEQFRGDCESKFAGRKDALNLTLSGSGHATYYSDKARQAVIEFVNKRLQAK